MDIEIKTKWCWPFSLIFKPKEYEYKVHSSEATKKQAELMKKDLRSDIRVGGGAYCKKCGEYIYNAAFNMHIHLMQCENKEDLRSDIRVRLTKLGGGGVCCYCNKYQSNVTFHEARCPQRTELGGRFRG